MPCTVNVNAKKGSEISYDGSSRRLMFGRDICYRKACLFDTTLGVSAVKLAAIAHLQPPNTMSLRFRQVLRHYAGGLAGLFVGAWLTDLTGSVLPLALGASALLMCTVPLVKEIWAGRRDSR